MKISLIMSIFSLCLAHSSTEEGISKESKNSSKPLLKPPYHTNGTKTPYYYNSSIDSTKLRSILRQITKYTCLDFTKSSSQINNSIGINFLISKNGNNVSLSNSTDKPTNVSLEEDVYKDHKNISFYIGLALGIIPEIRRPDRNKELRFNKSNVNESFMQFFKKTNITDVPYINGTDFDFGSAMFFDPFFGSKNFHQTYNVTLYKAYQPSYGYGRILRHNDYKHIAKYYCNNTYNESDCKYGGYKVGNSDYKSICKCPEYLTGYNCSDLENNTATNCVYPRNLTANTTKSYLILTNITGKCLFNITSENKEKKVKVFVRSLGFENITCFISCPFVEILVRKDKGAKGIFLNRNSTGVKIPAISNEVFLVYYSNSKANFLNISYKEVNITKRNSTRSKKKQIQD